MKVKSLLTAGLLALSGSAIAQSWRYDSVAMGAGYSNDVFYEIKQGASAIRPGNEWDLAFQMTAWTEPSFNATIRANHAKKAVEVYSLNLGGAKFGNLTPADSIGKTNPARQLFNDDKNWGNGAFYQNRLVADPFSYGWGKYNLGNHNLYGDSIYLVKVAGVAYQVFPEMYISAPNDSIKYIVHIAKFDGSNANTLNVYRKSSASDFSNRLFAYYDITTNTVLQHEPMQRAGWDLMFTQYVTPVMGPNGIQPYPVTGILTNFGTEVAKLKHLNPDDVTPTNFKGYQRTLNTDEIGYDWKTYDQAASKYILDDSGSYIVKTSHSKEYWQIQFTRFDGSAGGGKIVFRKRLLGDYLSVNNVAAQALNAFTVAPNPASNEATLMLDAKKAASAQIVVTDMAGRSVMVSNAELKGGINAYNLNTANWPAGIYAVLVVAQDWKASSRLVVAH